MQGPADGSRPRRTAAVNRRWPSGRGIAGVELLTAFPYFAAIGIIAGR